MSFQVNETNSKVTVDETVTTLVVEDKAARVTITGDGTEVEITAPGPQGAKGETGAQGPKGDTGAGGALGYYGSFYNTTTQTAASTTVAYPLRINSTTESNGVSITNDGDGNPTQITFDNAGTYQIVFSAQLTNPSNSEEHCSIWFRLNGNDIAHSRSQFTVPRLHKGENGAVVGTVEMTMTLAAGDDVQLIWQTESTSIIVEALPVGTTPTSPASPSLIVSATQVMYTQVGPEGPSGVVAVTAPVTNTGTSTSANIGLSTGTGLNVTGGALTVLYGTTSGTAAAGDDARLSDARTPLAHAPSHHTGGSDPLTATNIGAAEATTQMVAGTGLSGGGTLEANRTFTVLYGTTAGTAAQGNDARLSDARTPTAHASTHFTGGDDPINATNIGAVPEARQVISGTGLAGGGDLSADRTLSVLYGTTSGTAAAGNDTRLSDARTPTAHASTHFTGGSDALTATNIGAAEASIEIIAGTALTGGGTLEADRTLNVLIGTTSGAVASGDRGLIVGGGTAQVLRKTSGTDYAVEWASVWEDDQTILAGQVFG